MAVFIITAKLHSQYVLLHQLRNAVRGRLCRRKQMKKDAHIITVKQLQMNAPLQLSLFAEKAIYCKKEQMKKAAYPIIVKRQEHAQSRQLQHVQQDKLFKRRQMIKDVYLIIAKGRHAQLLKSQPVQMGKA